MLPPQIFTRARDWPRLPSAHPNWDGGPPPPPQKKINRENLKFGLKFSVLDSITSMPVGISSPNFYRRRDELWSTYKKVIARILTYPNCTYTVSWRKFIRHARGSRIQCTQSFASFCCCETNFEYLNCLSTRTCYILLWKKSHFSRQNFAVWT